MFNTLPAGNGTTTIDGGDVLIEDNDTETEIIGGNIITNGPIKVGSADDQAEAGDIYVGHGLSTVHSTQIGDSSSAYHDETIVTDILCLGASGEFYNYDGTSCRDAWEGPGPENWFIFRESTDPENLGHSYFLDLDNEYQEGNIRLDGIIEVKCQDGEDIVSGIKIGDSSYIYDSSCTTGGDEQFNIHSGENIEIKSTTTESQGAIELNPGSSGSVNVIGDFTVDVDAYHVSGVLDVMDNLTVGSIGTDYVLYVDVTDNEVGIGTASPEFTLDVNGDLNISGSATITSKLTVDVIDPIYEIEGERYATYGHSIIGLKEEILGKAELYKETDKGFYTYSIDFSKQEKGSDLWLFNEITDFGNDWDNLIVILTPEGRADVWYEVFPEEDLLIIFGDNPIKVSYRLIAPRFDYLQHPTYLHGYTSGGLKVR